MHCHLLYLLTPEYQAAAIVALMTTSTGIRSATALFEARIVRRIPFPALKQKVQDKKAISSHFSFSEKYICLHFNFYLQQ